MSEEHLPRYDRVLEESETIVIKMGSSLILRDGDDGKVIDAERLNAFIQDISWLVNEHGKRIVLVSSGAVGLGRKSISRVSGAETLEEKQAAATVGNPALMAFYASAFGEKGGLSVGQVLMTPAHTREPRRRYNNPKYHSYNVGT